MRRFPIVLAGSLAVALAVTGCSSGSTSSKTAASATPTTSAASPTGSAAATGAAPTTSAGPKLPAGTELPTATGSFGDKPVLTFPTKTGPPTTVQTKILHQGTGPVVAKKDLLMADYLGQIWGGKVFDNSYDRKAPSGFQIGAGQVIPGWDSTLVGLKAGTRVLLSIPPAEGYGPSGQTDAGISGTDTLVFVVDVIGSYGPKVGPDPKAAVVKLPANGPQVSGALTAAPKVTIPTGVAAPTKPSAVVVAKGSGKPVTDGTVVLQYEAVTWTGQAAGSTRTTGAPIAVPIGGGQATPFDPIKGLPVGSRVLLMLPASTSQSSATASPTPTPAVAVVVDIVAQVPTAKAAGSS